MKWSRLIGTFLFAAILAACSGKDEISVDPEPQPGPGPEPVGPVEEGERLKLQLTAGTGLRQYAPARGGRLFQ